MFLFLFLKKTVQVKELLGRLNDVISRGAGTAPPEVCACGRRGGAALPSASPSPCGCGSLQGKHLGEIWELREGDPVLRGPLQLKHGQRGSQNFLGAPKNHRHQCVGPTHLVGTSRHSPQALPTGTETSEALYYHPSSWSTQGSFSLPAFTLAAAKSSYCSCD